MQIPTKIQHGEKVIATVFDKINGIIDYLNASRIRKGPGILVDESPSGTVIKLADRPATPPQVLPAGSGGASGLVATVSDGTATVEISGSTALVIKPGANIQISGGTNGELIISATGGGGGSTTCFPDYSSPVDSVVLNTYYGEYANSVWVIGSAKTEYDGASNQQGAIRVFLLKNDGDGQYDIVDQKVLFMALVGDPAPSGENTFIETQICMPIPAGYKFYFDQAGTSIGVIRAKIYPCI